MRKKVFTLGFLIENFFTEYLVQQKKVSAHTISSYRDTFRLFFQFVIISKNKKLNEIILDDLNIDTVLSFLNDLELNRSSSARSRNQRLAAIKSFLRHANIKLPDKSDLIHRVLSLSNKRTDDRIVDFLILEEQAAILKAPDRSTWIGRRDHMLILFAIETGLRVSELLNIKRTDLELDQHPNVYCMGKGRKERRTPIGKITLTALREWLKEPKTDAVVFANRNGHPMTTDTVQSLLKKYQKVAVQSCPTLDKKRISPHVLRHTTAMNLLQAGVDSSVIALWLGHSSIETTMKVYIKANLALKEKALMRVSQPKTPYRRYKPSKGELSFLESL